MMEEKVTPGEADTTDESVDEKADEKVEEKVDEKAGAGTDADAAAETVIDRPAPKTDAAGRPTGRIIAGIVLLLPAAFFCIFQLLIPTLQTFVLSLQDASLIRESEFIGVENYGRVFTDRLLPQAVGFTLSFIVARLVVASIVPLLLAWGASRFGRALRIAVRVLFTVPVALFMPLAIAVAWILLLSPATNPLLRSGPFPLATQNGARAILLLVDAIYTFGLACGLGMLVLPAVWRRPEDSPPPTLGQSLIRVLATWGTGMLATIALTVPIFTPVFAMTMGGPATSTMTMGLWQYMQAFRNMRAGYAAVVAVIILVPVMLVGLLAGLLVILTRLRFVPVKPIQGTKETSEAPKQGRVIPGIALAIAMLLGLGVCSLGTLPFLWVGLQSFGESGYGRLLDQIPVAGVFISTIVPVLVVSLVQLLLAYPAALGIGAMRPIGKWSEWLLLPFSPWLFVTVLPLSITAFMSAREAGTLNTLVGLIPPIMLSVPVLFILTLFFGGQSARYRTALKEGEPGTGAFFKHLVLPSLPVVGVLLVFQIFVGWQQTVWPFIAAQVQKDFPVNVALLRLVGMSFADRSILAAGSTLFNLPVSLFLFVALAAFQVFYLDNLAVRTGGDADVDV